LVPSEKMRLMEIAVLKARAEADKKAKEEAAALALLELEEEPMRVPTYRMNEREMPESLKKSIGWISEDEIEEGEGSVEYEEEDESW